MWINIILCHIYNRAILGDVPRYEVSKKVLAWYIDPNGIENITSSNMCTSF